MFEDYHFLVVKSSQDKKDVDKLLILLENDNSKVLVKEDGDNDENILETCTIDHIVTSTTEFTEYATAKRALIPVTTPQWVFDSVNSNKILNYKDYNPNPRYFMKDCFVCASDDVSTNDKEIIYGGVKAFGGQYLDDLTKNTTHLITNSLENDKATIALSADIDIKIVSPRWIDDCLKSGKRIQEGPYLLEDIREERDETSDTTESPSPNRLSYNANFLDDKRFYISKDYNFSKHLYLAIVLLILNNGGKVQSKFHDSVDVYIGKYRDGDEFIKSSKSNHIRVGTLQWLYYIIINRVWVEPLESLLLHYPIPKHPLPGFENFKISITNYSGDARQYLSSLITILGGTFTKTLTKDNQFLIAAKPTGKKYDTAKTKWTKANEPIIKVVNCRWLEECFSKWEVMDPKQINYSCEDNNSMNCLGSIKLDKEVLKHWTDFDVDDSMHEDEALLNPEGQERNNEEPDTDYSEEEEKSERPEINQKENTIDHQSDENQQDAVNNEDGNIGEVSKGVNDPSTSPKSSQLGQLTPTKTKSTPISSRATPEADSDPDILFHSRGRQAKNKASEKLHNNMSDLNEYQKIFKSNRMMKDYMTNLETPNKRKPENKENITPPSSKKSKTDEISNEDSNGQVPQLNVVAVMTGCEKDIKLSRSDIQRLKHLNIKIASDVSSKVNTLIAPKILRTEKFLSCLSFVDHIIHPNYILDLKENLDHDEVLTRVNLEDYSIEKVVPIKDINNDLGYSKDTKENGIKNILNSPNQGSIFNDYKLNLSINLNGGFDVLSKILISHGVQELKSVNFKNTINSKSLIENESGETYLVCHKTKDSKLIDYIHQNKLKVTLVEWDWCVKSIFQQKIQSVSNYKL